MLGKLFPIIAAAIAVLAGCTPQIRQPSEICPGKATVAEALAALQSHSQNIVPMRANGQCRLEYYLEEKKEPQRENFDVRLWVNPPLEIYLQGNKALVPKAIVLGSNEREFWLSIKPKEISTHWWGNWAEQDLSKGLLINPRTLLESLGIEEVKTQRNWSLSNEGPYDIIAKKEDGVIIKKIYIYCCDYRVRKIEFFDRDGQAVADAELGNYKEVSDGFSIPSLIIIKTYTRETREAPLSITLFLKSIKPATITELRRKVLFGLPTPRGFKHIYRVVNGKWFEESQ